MVAALQALSGSYIGVEKWTDLFSPRPLLNPLEASCPIFIRDEDGPAGRTAPSADEARHHLQAEASQ
jgi:hypothetical protein